MRMNNTLDVYKFLWSEYQNIKDDFNNKSYKGEFLVVENPKSIYFKRANGVFSRYNDDKYFSTLRRILKFVNRYYFLYKYFNDECRNMMVDFIVAYDMINGMEGDGKGYIDKFFYNTIILNEEKYEPSCDNCKE